MNCRRRAISKQYWVWMNCAPAAIFLARRSGAPVERLRERILGGTEKHARRIGDLAPALEAVLVAQRARDLEQRDEVEIEYRLRLRMVARLHAVPGEAQQVATPMAAPPRMSPWIAIRFRSRQEICMIGA